MAKVVDVSGINILPLSRLYEIPTFPRRFVIMPGGEGSKVLPLIWRSTERIETAHSAFRPSPDIDLFVLNHAKVGGRGAAIKYDGSYLWSYSLYPSYIRQYYENDISQERWSFDDGLTPIKVKSAFSVMHFNFGYGHWLTEIFPKLFLLKSLRDIGVKAPLIWPKTAHQHLLRRTAEFLESEEFIIYDPNTQYVQAETTFLPGSGGCDHFFNPILRYWFDGYAKSISKGGDRKKAIYISRQKITYNYGFRKLKNSEYLEKIAKSEGMEIYYPEKESPKEQVSMFATADLIVGEFGSGIHNAIFSPPGTKVVALNWINSVQSRIGNLMGHKVGYILPSDGQPRLFRNDGKVEEYEIESDTFAERLSCVLKP